MDVASLIKVKSNPNIPALAPGDTVKVSTKVVEGDRERTQLFQGIVIRVRHGGVGANFTVRRIAHGFGVERTFPFYSPLVDKVAVVRRGQVRGAQRCYLFGSCSYASRLRGRECGKERDDGLSFITCVDSVVEHLGSKRGE